MPTILSAQSQTFASLPQTSRCRLVAILGMGGIGKTALAVKLAEQVQDRFEYLFWRSLRNAPPVEDILNRTAPIPV